MRTNESEYIRKSISTDMDRWSLISFIPSQDSDLVVADRDRAAFYFSDANNTRFDWLGELKAEFAQRIAQEFASGLSRVAVDESEWLRREAK